MTKPLRRDLLNAEISAEARRIAHSVTPTCKGPLLPNERDCHTNNCNRLKAEIEQLALSVKLASVQPPIDEREPPPFELQECSK